MCVFSNTDHTARLSDYVAQVYLVFSSQRYVLRARKFGLVRESRVGTCRSFGFFLFSNLQDKDPSRRIIDLRLYTRIAGEGGIASSNGITTVSEQVCDFLEEALQVRLKGFVANVSKCAARRNDANKDAFKKSHSALEPKQKARFILRIRFLTVRRCQFIFSFRFLPLYRFAALTSTLSGRKQSAWKKSGGCVHKCKKNLFFCDFFF